MFFRHAPAISQVDNPSLRMSKRNLACRCVDLDLNDANKREVGTSQVPFDNFPY